MVPWGGATLSIQMYSSSSAALHQKSVTNFAEALDVLVPLIKHSLAASLSTKMRALLPLNLLANRSMAIAARVHLGLVDDPPLVASLHPCLHDGVTHYTTEELVARHRLVGQHAADPDNTILLRTVREDQRQQAWVLEVQRSRPSVGKVPRPEPEVLDGYLVHQGAAPADCLR